MGSLTKNIVFTAQDQPEKTNIQYLNFVLDYEPNQADKLPNHCDFIINFIHEVHLDWQAKQPIIKPLEPSALQNDIIEDIIQAANQVFADCGLTPKPFSLSQDMLILSSADQQKIYQQSSRQSFTGKSECPQGFFNNGKIIMDGEAEPEIFSWLFAHEYAHFQAGTTQLWRIKNNKPIIYGTRNGFALNNFHHPAYFGLNEGTTELFGFMFRSIYFQTEKNERHNLYMSYGPEPLYIYDILLNSQDFLETSAKLLKAYLAGDTSIWKEFIPERNLRKELIHSKNSAQSAGILKRYNDPRFKGQFIYKDYGL